MVHLWEFLRCSRSVYDWRRDMGQVVWTPEGCLVEERDARARGYVLLGAQTGCRAGWGRAELLHGSLRDDPGHALPLHPSLPAVRQGQKEPFGRRAFTVWL